MQGTHWIVEGRIDPRWPINTRGNIGEVFPEVLTPMSYELGVLAAEAGWRDAYRDVDEEDRLVAERPGLRGTVEQVAAGARAPVAR